jgi:DNA integrity scanning protein DisA with diadenylate cyclase activity
LFVLSEDEDMPKRGGADSNRGPEKDKTVHMLAMEGDIDQILSNMKSGMGKKRMVIRRTMEILVGLSLKGYEGKPVGAIFLIGDIEGIRRQTSQMIINPFKGWKDINILDEGQQLTFESFSQLDGAFVLDHRGFAHYAGRMIHVREEEACNDRKRHDTIRDRKGTGTRWRASKHITERTKTVAVSLSHNGDITVFERGKEIGRLSRKLMNVDSEKLRLLISKE